jgi:hypothetical protein
VRHNDVPKQRRLQQSRGGVRMGQVPLMETANPPMLTQDRLAVRTTHHEARLHPAHD